MESVSFRCGHCKAMEPEYNKLAKWMKKKNPNLLVAKMDATANDVHIMFGNLRGYPTIFFLPVDSKEQFIQYQEESYVFKSFKVNPFILTFALVNIYFFILFTYSYDLKFLIIFCLVSSK